MAEVTDPSILAQLKKGGGEVTDPGLLAQLNAPDKQEPQQPSNMSWGQVAGQAVSNIPSSAVQFGKDIAQPFLHPVDTATSFKNIGLGALESAGILAGREHVPYLESIGQFFSERYGGLENVKRTIASDPVGAMGDISMLLTGGETALARAPGLIGKVGRVAGTAGRAANPLNLPGKLVKGAGTLAAEGAGLLTGAGPQAVRTAARAGYEGGEAGRAFQESIRGAAPLEDVVSDARGAIKQMRQERGATYTAAMKRVGADKTVLSFNELDTALNEMDKVATYKGQSLSPSTEKIRQQIHTEVDKWKDLQASEYWTVEGFDALKKKIGDIRDGTQYGTPERVAADRAYQAVRKTIISQAPAYARVMKGYEEASKQIKEIERALSLNEKASVDTALRKLQSALRDNVSSSYGHRRQLAQFLIDNGAPHLMERLAGQGLNPWTARGLGKLGQQLATEVAMIGLGMATGGMATAGAAAALPLMSPRLVGEGAYYAGRAASPTKYAPTRAGLVSGETGKSAREAVPRKRDRLRVEITKPRLPPYGGDVQE